MQRSALIRTTLLATGVVAALGVGAPRVEAGYVQTNLVSDLPGLAIITDSSLVNPWGISWGLAPPNPGTPFWVSDQKKNVTTLYNVNSAGVSKVREISIPTSGGGPGQGPTGQVSNIGGSNFVIS